MLPLTFVCVVMIAPFHLKKNNYYYELIMRIKLLVDVASLGNSGVHCAVKVMMYHPILCPNEVFILKAGPKRLSQSVVA